MKQAVLILSGIESGGLPFLVDQFDGRFNIYIHIDKKFNVSRDFVCALFKRQNVKHVSQLYETNWGSMNIVNATLHLCEEALCDSDNSHFHLISGADFPVASNEAICEKFKSEKDNHIEFKRFPHPDWEGGGYYRLNLYHPLDYMDIRKPEFQIRYHNFIKYQKAAGIRRHLLDIPYYGGSTWWSLSRKCVKYIVDNKHADNLYASMQDTWVPDEIFIQTLLLNSPMRTELVNDNLRFIMWKQKNGNCPANLDVDDFEEIMSGGFLFMRKVDKECSAELVRKISFVRNNTINI